MQYLCSFDLSFSHHFSRLSSRFIISHPKNVVCLDPLTDSCVARDGFSDGFGGGFHLFLSIEDFLGFSQVLRSVYFRLEVVLSRLEKCVFVSLKLFILSIVGPSELLFGFDGYDHSRR